jgi:hypothetical protein
MPIIAIKGYTAFALTGDPATLRPSGDLDLTCGDLAVLKRTLADVGYQLKGEEMAYNYIKGRRGDIFIEVHRYCPIYFFSSPMTARDVLPEQNPGHWHQAVTVRCDSIPYSALRSHAMPAVQKEAEGIVVPDPTMAAFIRCVHTFKHCSFVFPRKIASVPLADLAEIREFVAHPRFDPLTFSKLITEFGGQYDVLRP